MDKQIPQIRLLKEKGWNIQKIADSLKVHRNTIQRVLSGKFWRHI